MKNRRAFILLLALTITLSAYSQKSTLWISYGQSIFLYSPGLEYTYYFWNNVGIQAGVNSCFQNYEPTQVSNASSDKSFIPLHNFNLGISAIFLSENDHKLGATIGAKMYYGPDFRVTHYYEEGGYNIYYDPFRTVPNLGVDMGLYYNYNLTFASLSSRSHKAFEI